MLIHWRIQFIYLIFKDTPLLDCVGLQYPRRDLSFNFSIRILRSVNLFDSLAALDSLPLVMWITAAFLPSPVRDDNILVLTSLTASMTVNALMTGLIVFRMFKTFPNVKGVTTSDEKYLDFTTGKKLRSIIFVMIDSGMVLFAIQLARLSISATGLKTDVENDVFALIANTHPMFNVNITYAISHHCFIFY
jgi:hypothetical protein